MTVHPPTSRSPRQRRPRMLWLVMLGVLPLLAACTLTTDDPSSYNAVTEANVLNGCVSEQDLAYAGLITVDEQGTSDRSDDIVVIPEEIPADVVDPCQCFYEGIVKDISFADFDDLDRSLRDLPEGTDDQDSEDSDADDADPDDDEQQRAETLAALGEIAEGCSVPS